MDIFENLSNIIGSQKDEFQKVYSEDNYTFIGNSIVYTSFNGLNDYIQNVDLVFNLSEKKNIIVKLINNVGNPIEGTENEWKLSKTLKSDFSESLIEKRHYLDIDKIDISDLENLDLLRWSYNEMYFTILNHPLIRGFSGDYFYLNIKKK